jgi:hypothetical protein
MVKKFFNIEPIYPIIIIIIIIGGIARLLVGLLTLTVGNKNK